MQRIFERIKSGESCGIDESPRTFIQSLDEIITAELSWGASTRTEGNSHFFETKVFGDIDKTEFKCNPEEFELLSNIIAAYRQGGRNAVNTYLLSVIGIDGTTNRYKTEDVLILLEMHLAGSKASELIDLLTPVVPKKDSSQPMRVSSELTQLAKCLDPDDAVLRMVNGLNAAYMLNELQQSVK